MATYSAQHVARSIRTFNDYANDLLSADDANSFSNAFNQFMSHCLNDPVMRAISEPLRSHPHINLPQWLAEAEQTGGSFIGSKRFVLPTDPEQKLSLIFQFLLAVYEGRIDLLGFSLDFFGATHDYEMIAKFNQNFTQPFVREVSYRLKEHEPELAAVPSDRIDEASLSGFVVNIQTLNVGRGAAVQISGHNSRQSAIVGQGAPADIAALLAELREQAQHLPESQRKAAEGHIGVVESISRLDTPSQTAARPFLETLKSIFSSSETIAKLIDLIGNIWSP